MKRLLVTGGTGLVGYALRSIFPGGVYLGSRDYDLTKEEQVAAMFDKYRPEYVIHLAAKVGGILDNLEHPADFFYQNMMINTLVINYAYKNNVRRLIGVVSNCSYPDSVSSYPMKENQLHQGPPAASNFSYGYAKRMLEVQINSYRKQYNCDYFCVIPCSLYGPNDKFTEKTSHFIPALIEKIHRAKMQGDKTIRLMGTGLALRQYLYSYDLAKVLLELLEKYDGQGPLNVGPAENLSIKEISEIALKATQANGIKIVFDNSSCDGQLRKDISSDKLFGFIGNFKTTPLEEGIRKTYQWYVENLNNPS